MVKSSMFSMSQEKKNGAQMIDQSVDVLVTLVGIQRDFF